MIIAGPLLQPIRASSSHSLSIRYRGVFSTSVSVADSGWTLVALGSFSTFGPDSGSSEGLIYTTIPIRKQLSGWLEIIPQAVLFAGLLNYRVNHPEKRWLTRSLAVVSIAERNAHRGTFREKRDVRAG